MPTLLTIHLLPSNGFTKLPSDLPKTFQMIHTGRIRKFRAGIERKPILFEKTGFSLRPV